MKSIKYRVLIALSSIFVYSNMHSAAHSSTGGRPGLAVALSEGAQAAAQPKKEKTPSPKVSNPEATKSMWNVLRQLPVNIKALQEALEAGANPNERAVGGYTPLGYVSISSTLTDMEASILTELLLAHGANPLFPTRVTVWGKPYELPLHIATAKGKVGLMSMLLSINPQAQVNVRNSMGHTPLTLVVDKGNQSSLQQKESAIDLLLSKGADLFIKGYANRTILETVVDALTASRQEKLSDKRILEHLRAKLSKRPAVFSVAPSTSPQSFDTGATRLMWRALESYPRRPDTVRSEALKLALESHAHPNVRNAQGYTPLSYTQMQGEPDEEFRSVATQNLIAYGADPAMSVLPSDPIIPLHWAISTNEIKLINILLSKNSESQVSALDERRRTPLQVNLDWSVCRGGEVDLAIIETIMDLLLDKGADLCAPNQEGDTILAIALREKADLDEQVKAGQGVDLRWRDNLGHIIKLLKSKIVKQQAAVEKAMFQNPELSAFPPGLLSIISKYVVSPSETPAAQATVEVEEQE